MNYKKERDSLKDALDELQDEFNALQEQFDQLQVDMEEEANSSGKLEDELKERIDALEEERDSMSDKIADLEADLHAMRAARDSLISWIKVIMESEYTLSVIQTSGRIVIKESLAEAERPAIYRGRP